MEDSSSLTSDENNRPSRVRTMTGSSIGSFSSYLLPHEKERQQETPRMVVSHPKARPVTPSPSERSLSREQELEQELEQVKWERQEALEALRQLAEGIRVVTRQIKQSHALAEEGAEDEDARSSSSTRGDVVVEEEEQLMSCTSSLQSYSVAGSEYDRQMSSITQQLDDTGVALGADLMSLSHAAQMVHENVKLVSQEATDLAEDCTAAQQQEAVATERAQKLETVAKRLYKENTVLNKKVESLKSEKKILIKEVKTLHQERAAARQEEQETLRNGMLKMMEDYVAGALRVHEQQLAKTNTTASKETRKKQSNDLTKELKEDHIASSQTMSVEEDGTKNHDSSCDTTPTRNTENAEDDKEKSRSSASGGLGFGASGALGFGLKQLRSVCSLDFEAETSGGLDKDIKQQKPVKQKAKTDTLPAAHPAPYKPLTLATPKNNNDDSSPKEESSNNATRSNPKEEDRHQPRYGRRVKKFFQMHQSTPAHTAEKQTSLLKLEDLEKDDEHGSQVSTAPESRSPSASPELQQDDVNNRHDPSPLSHLLPQDIQIDVTSDCLLSPIDNYDDDAEVACNRESKRVVAIPIVESNLLRSLAVPSTPLIPIRPRPSPMNVARDDGLYEC